MKNLELYAGLLAGGLGTGYNLYQGDSLTNSLAQGAILGSAIGGGMYGGNKLNNILTLDNISKHLNNISINEIDIPTTNISSIGLEDSKQFINSLAYLKSKKLDGTITPEEDKLLSSVIKMDLDKDDIIFEKGEHNRELQNNIIDHNKKVQTINKDINYEVNKMYDYLNNINNNYKNTNMLLTTGTGLIGGMTINDILFQDKSEREQAQLLSELELLKANGSISPYLDDYLMRNK